CLKAKARQVLEVGLDHIDTLPAKVRRWVFTEADDAALRSTDDEEVRHLVEEKGQAMVQLRNLFLAGGEAVA
ncbi:hypothetical protein HK405_011462, partial [Cladochytrium tenue]